ADARAVPEGGFGESIVGSVIDVVYNNGDEFRMKITSYLSDVRWYATSSAGYSDWDGEVFEDTLDVSQMFLNGQIVFVPEAELEKPARRKSSASGRGRGRPGRGLRGR
ncbi:unnamed protein product, partial [Polarella glacialis]